MIKLKNVSKFYYSKGVIASGFSKVNLEFKIGEFVAITGESGSGKSTLLNVISGLDTYEEGEMYINGEETSHYTEKDFEEYRRKYIGNIFQNFNLVNSYTVYQNIELVLLLNGCKSKDIKAKVIELIKKVDLYKFKNTKVSKLSGGQKQRVAIARALAKDTPIIIADEPTGNLDSRSAKGIIKLLSEIAHDKLVIIVTHNYEQVEDYVTRKIKMHDGKVLEDKKIKEVNIIKRAKTVDYKNITFLNKIRLGLRNTFNIVPKFLLVFAVYLFITMALIFEYSSFKKEEYISSKSGYNYYFSNIDDTRIIIKKKDGSSFTEDDYDKIKSIENVDYIIKNDLLIDTNINITDNYNYWIYGTLLDKSLLKGDLDLGRMPEADNEIIIEGSKNDYYIGYKADELLEKELYLRDIYTDEIDKSISLKVVGIKYTATDNYSGSSTIYVSESILKKLDFQVNQQYSDMKVLFEGRYYTSNIYTTNFKIVPSQYVTDNQVYISNNLNYSCSNQNCLNRQLNIEVDNLYYKDSINLTITQTYTKNNFKTLLGLDYNELLDGAIYISINDYNRLFNKGNYQSSVFVKDVNEIDSVINELDNNYTTLKIVDTLVNTGATQILQIIRTIVTIVLVIVLFFISYFVIRIILKSRNVYFTTIRILGASKKISKDLLIIELFVVSNLAYFIFMLFIYLNKIEVLEYSFMNTVINYLSFKDYLILYIILILMSYLISQKFAKKLFNKSAISTIKEEV